MVRGIAIGVCAVAVAATALTVAGPVVGDTTGPQITVITPKTGTVFDQELRIEASATDPDGLGRFTFEADGKEIRNFTKELANGKPVGLLWRGARNLAPGEHTITIVALQKDSDDLPTGVHPTTEVNVTVRRVKASALAKAKTVITLKLSGSGLQRTVSGRVSAPVVGFPRETFPLTGKVRVIWEVFSNKRWKVRHKDSADAASPYRLRQRLAKKGRWRVRVFYDPEAPYAASKAQPLTFTAKK